MNPTANTPIADELAPKPLSPARSAVILVATDGSESSQGAYTAAELIAARCRCPQSDPPMPHQTESAVERAETALRAQIAATIIGRVTDLGQLRQCVGEFTALLRDLELPPEKVLVRVKAAAFIARAAPVREERGALDSRDAQHLLERLVGWCIEDYFCERPADLRVVSTQSQAAPLTNERQREHAC